jgi:hypothetical protein
MWKKTEHHVPLTPRSAGTPLGGARASRSAGTMLSDVMLSDVMLSDVMLSDVMLSDVMLSDVMLSGMIVSTCDRGAARSSVVAFESLPSSRCLRSVRRAVRAPSRPRRRGVTRPSGAAR